MAACNLGLFCTNLTELPRLPEQDLLVIYEYELGQLNLDDTQHRMKVCRRQWITALSESFLPVVTFNQSNLKASVERILKT